jgi:ABC-type transport system involved in multi-copper enzyme maturation permease subunit
MQRKKMFSLNYFFKNLREHLSFLIFAFILVGIFQLLMLTLVVETDLLNIAKIFFSRFPPQVQQFLGEELLAQFSVNGAVAFGYNHPIVLIFLAVIAIMLPAKHLAGEIEGGSLELLFSLPIKRFKLAFTLWILSILSLLVVIIGGWVGTFIGLMIYPQVSDLPLSIIFRIGLNLWFLMLAINAYTFLFSSFSRESGKVTQRAAGLTLFFYFLGYTVRLWNKASFLKPITIFTYYQPQSLAMNQNLWLKNIGILAVLVIIFMVVAFRRINRRDIPG